MRTWRYLLGAMCCGAVLVACGGDGGTTNDGLPGHSDGSSTGGTDAGGMPVAMGTLIVTAKPSDLQAEVVLDGERTGKMTPTSLQVLASAHEVGLVRTGYISAPWPVTILANGRADIEVPIERDLSGRWALIDPNDGTEVTIEITLGLEGRRGDARPCPSAVWAGPFDPIGDVCVNGERLAVETTDGHSSTTGRILADGRQVDLTKTRNTPPPPVMSRWVYERRL